jgi:hypothetical protein
MGRWLATVRFGDGTVRYADYSTNTESLLSGLYEAVCRVGEVHPDNGLLCYRAAPAGEPLPADPHAAPAPPDELVPVTVEVEPDGYSWHALYCPRRGLVLGPMSYGHARQLQEEYELAPDGAGLRHLRPADPGDRADAPPTAVCGLPASGPALPFHCQPWCFELPDVDDAPEPPRIDLFASWTDGTVCRACLVSQVPG